jgi:hypothetical protein
MSNFRIQSSNEFQKQNVKCKQRHFLALFTHKIYFSFADIRMAENIEFCHLPFIFHLDLAICHLCFLPFAILFFVDVNLVPQFQNDQRPQEERIIFPSFLMLLHHGSYSLGFKISSLP